MIQKKIKYFIFALLCIITVQLLFATACYADAPTPTSNGLFNDEILQKMHLFMLRTNQALRAVMMIGDGLMCYAIHVHYHAIEISYWVGSYELFRYPDLGFWLVGAAIYAVGVFMAMSIGMYFVDISFKFGFAIIFMPISIALWPFPPTKSKFGDNLSIIIRNAMLFMLVGIGVTFAVKLINAGLLADGAETSFWSAIENDEVEQLTDSFSFFNTHILVVFFSLMYGFKILEGSVNNYLNAFFSDAAFGSESPMHHMGTQAVGMVTENTVKPALSFAKDVATHQTGRAIAGAAAGAGLLFSTQGRAQIGRGIKNGYNKVKGGVTTAARGITFAVRNPGDAVHNTAQYARNQYNKGMQKAGAAANRAIHSAGNAAKSIHDNITAFAPTPLLRESWRQKQVNAFNSMIDRATDKVGGAAEAAIAKGGGAVRHAAVNPRETYNKAMHAAGKGVNSAAHGLENVARKAQRQKLDHDFNKQVNKAEKQFKKGNITAEQRDALIANAEQTRINKIQDFDKKSNELAQKAFVAGTKMSGKLGKKDAEWRKQKIAAFKQIKESGASLSDVIGGSAEDTIAHGGNAVKEAAKKATAATGAAAYNIAHAAVGSEERTTSDAVRGQLHQQHMNHLANKAQKADDKQKRKDEKAEQREMRQQQREMQRQMKEAQAEADRLAKLTPEDKAVNTKADELRKAEENLKQAQAERIKAGANITAGKKNLRNVSKDEKPAAEEELKQAREELQRARDKLLQAQNELIQAQGEYMQAVEKSNMSVAAKAAKIAQIHSNRAMRQSQITLAPTRMISTAFRTVFHPQQQMRKLADNMNAIKGEFKEGEGTKFVLKKTGQIVLRNTAGSIARGVRDTVDDTGGFLTKMVQKFGEGLADNSSHGGERLSLKQQWDQKNAEEIRQQKEEAERREYFRELDV